MRRAKRNAAKLLSAAMAVGMMAGMAVPAAAEEESTNIWASDVIEHQILMRYMERSMRFLRKS